MDEDSDDENESAVEKRGIPHWCKRATIGPTMPVMWSAQKATGGKGNRVKEHARIDAGESSNAGPAATPAAFGNAIGCHTVTGKETDAGKTAKTTAKEIAKYS